MRRPLGGLGILESDEREDEAIDTEQEYWFPVKRYGWGWGLPVRWQGWVLLIAYLVLLYAGIRYFRMNDYGVEWLLYFVVLTAAVIAIVAVKGERPVRWRWGKK